MFQILPWSFILEHFIVTKTPFYGKKLFNGSLTKLLLTNCRLIISKVQMILKEINFLIILGLYPQRPMRQNVICFASKKIKCKNTLQEKTLVPERIHF